jgi:carbonic anhydrase
LEKETLIWCSPEETVKEDVKILRESSFFKGQQIVGLVQDTETGLLKEIVWAE